MKYTWKSIKYIGKNFIYLLPFALLPAFFFALSIDEEALEVLLRGLAVGEYISIDFATVLRSVSFLGFSSGKSVLTGILGVIALVLGVSLMMAYSERHMRIGKRGYRGIFSKLNDNLISTGGIAVLLLVCYELFALILSALVYLFMQISVRALAIIFCSLAFVGMHLVLLYVIMLGYLWLPCIHITGFRAFEALRYSYQLCYSIKKKIILDQLWLLIVSEILIVASVFIPADAVIPVLLATVLYAFMIMLFCVRMHVVYFDRAQIERADLKKYYDR